MNFNLAGLIKAAVLNGTPLLFGTSGEILTEKSGNLNLGVEGLMFMGGAFGLAGAFWYDQLAGEGASGIAAVLIALLCAWRGWRKARERWSFSRTTNRNTS